MPIESLLENILTDRIARSHRPFDARPEIRRDLRRHRGAALVAVYGDLAQTCPAALGNALGLTERRPGASRYRVLIQT